MGNNRRFSEIILGLFLLFLGLSAIVEGGSIFMTFLVLAGIFMLVRRFDNEREEDRSRERPRERSRRVEVPDRSGDQREPSTESTRKRIYQHALEAVEAAGHDPETVKVLATDVGIMAFKDDSDPVVHRTRDVYDDVDYIQPYVQLRLPTVAVGLIRFEIVDQDGDIVFVHEERHQLERGRNLITPAARLPVHDGLLMNGAWALRVSADGMLLAVHEFGWQESQSKTVRRHLTEDGEISTELRAAMAENRLQTMSLDDLLEFQDDETDADAPAQQRSS